MIQKNALPRIRSIIEGQRGNAIKAVDLLAPVTQFPNAPIFFHLAQAYAVAGEHAKAAAQFEKVIVHRGWPEWEVFAPLAQLGLARAYAMQGERENSRKAYDDFFTTWKDADPDIPILKQARAEYKKLAATTPASASRKGSPVSPGSQPLV
jgi:eukaryotic-like serine/threonine-protein kinase